MKCERERSDSNRRCRRVYVLTERLSLHRRQIRGLVFFVCFFSPISLFDFMSLRRFFSVIDLSVNVCTGHEILAIIRSLFFS